MLILLIALTIICLLAAVTTADNYEVAVPFLLTGFLLIFLTCFFGHFYCSHHSSKAKINTTVLVYRHGEWLVVPSSELENELYYNLPNKMQNDSNDK